MLPLSMSAWSDSNLLPLFVFLTSLISIAWKLWPFIYLGPLYTWSYSLAHKDYLLLYLRVTWHAKLVYSFFRGPTHFQLPGALNMVLSASFQPHHSPLAFSNGVVFNQSSWLSCFLHAYTVTAWPFFDILVSSLPCQCVWPFLVAFSWLLLVLWGRLTCLACSNPSLLVTWSCLLVQPECHLQTQLSTYSFLGLVSEPIHSKCDMMAWRTTCEHDFPPTFFRI